jgi:two-component system, response regulator PdtaR
MPEQVKIMIVEDEAIVAMDLAAGLERDGYTVVGIANNYLDARRIFSDGHVDIVLMDINIQGEKDGVETAAELMKMRYVPLIYLTAFTDSDTIERVKNTNPSAFLVKPYTIENVRIAIDLALHHFAEAKSQNNAKVFSLSPVANTGKAYEKETFLRFENYVFIRQNYKFVKFMLSEILFACADNNYVHIHTKSQKLALRLSLTDLIDRLHFSQLVRIHRSYAVNLDKIDSFDDQVAKIGSHEIPIGRNYRQEFLEHFNWR